MLEDVSCNVGMIVCCVEDLSRDTGIHVSDITTTLQSLGLISVAADNHRCLLLFTHCTIKSDFLFFMFCAIKYPLKLIISTFYFFCCLTVQYFCSYCRLGRVPRMWELLDQDSLLAQCRSCYQRSNKG